MSQALFITRGHSPTWIALLLLAAFAYGVAQWGLKSIANWLVLAAAAMWLYEAGREKTGGDDSIWQMVLVVGSCALIFPWTVACVHRDMET